MSRVGRVPIEVPSNVKVNIAGQHISFDGPKGKMERTVRDEIEVVFEGGKLLVTQKVDTPNSSAFHGLERSLLNNCVVGVSEGFAKEMELNGVGYSANIKGSVLKMDLGYSHDIEFPLPKGIKGSVLKEGRKVFVRVEGVDKQEVGQVAAKIRSHRKPEPYKGKGIRYRDEVVKRKAGKSGSK